MAARLFLALNRIVLEFERDDAIAAMLALAAGDMSEDALADWFRKHIAAT